MAEQGTLNPKVVGSIPTRPTSAGLACVDGEVLPAAEARVPATDDGLLRGDGVFEALRLYGGRPFALEDHLARLARSGANLRLPVDLDAVRADVRRLLAAAAPSDGVLRIFLTRGGVRLLLLRSLPERPAALRAALVTYAPTRLLDEVKSLSYAANMLAGRIAEERGFDEALFVTPHGRVLEGPTWSLFYVLRGELWTPPLSDHILASITRARVVEETGARERSLARDELLSEDVTECFAASTVREVTPLAAIDDRTLPAPGPVTLAAAAALRARIERELSG